MKRKLDEQAIKTVMSLSPYDRIRLLQCVFCDNDPETCGCTERNEDKDGMCRKYNRHKIGGKN